MKLFILLVMASAVASRSGHTTPSSSSPDTNGDQNAVTQDLKKLRDMILNKVRPSRTHPAPEEKPTREESVRGDRKSRALNFYSFFPPALMHLAGYIPQNKNVRPVLSDEWLSRTEPFKRKTNHLVDSPTYYIRLPPNPYIYVPGVGYISRPPALSDPEVINQPPPTGNAEKDNEIVQDQFYHVPIDFMANGKPTSVHVVRPKPETSILSLNKGPYLFNGKPSDVYLLRNSLNSLYADALTNFYP